MLYEVITGEQRGVSAEWQNDERYAATQIADALAIAIDECQWRAESVARRRHDRRLRHDVGARCASLQTGRSRDEES